MKNPASTPSEKSVLKSQRRLPKSSLSLRPDTSVMDGCLMNDPYAIAIRDSWRFHFPVRVMPQATFNACPTWGMIGG